MSVVDVYINDGILTPALQNMSIQPYGPVSQFGPVRGNPFYLLVTLLTVLLPTSSVNSSHLFVFYLKSSCYTGISII